MVLEMMLAEGDLQFYVGSKLGADIPLISRVLSVVVMKVESVNRKLHAYLTGVELRALTNEGTVRSLCHIN